MMGLMLVVTSALLGIQYCMLYKITGSLWAGMAAHFINNASSNLLHIETITGIDELLTIRISVAQTLSFVIVLILFLRYRRLKQVKT
jgi:membrane protease YdiL (CAAX protease family)